jgi:DNA replication protein DnaC
MIKSAAFKPKIVRPRLVRQFGPDTVEDPESRHTHRCRHANIPLKDWDTMRTLHETTAIHAVTAFKESTDVMLVLSGNPGSGKTLAASKYLYDSTDGWFMDVSSLARLSRYDNESMEEVESYGVIVIDDLGMEFDDKSGSFRSLFDSIINARYSAMRKTIMTTNLDAAAFKERYGERVADRIRECGKFIVCAGASLRKK